MAHILYYRTHGSDEPTRAVLPFHMAKGAFEAGHTAEIALIGDATYLMKDSIAKEVKGIAVPNAAVIIAELAAQGVKINLWGGCSRARGVTEEDVKGKNASFGTPKDFKEAVVAADRVVGF